MPPPLPLQALMPPLQCQQQTAMLPCPTTQTCRPLLNPLVPTYIFSLAPTSQHDGTTHSRATTPQSTKRATAQQDSQSAPPQRSNGAAPQQDSKPSPPHRSSRAATPLQDTWSTFPPPPPPPPFPQHSNGQPRYKAVKQLILVSPLASRCFNSQSLLTAPRSLLLGDSIMR